MILATIPGTLGKDAEIRDTTGGPVLSFSIASEDFVKGQKTTTWVGCSMFGKRGEKLVSMLTKGSKVTVSGTLSTREHNGKTYLDCRVNEIALQGGGKRGGQSSDTPTSQGGGYSDEDYGGGPGISKDDDFPF